MINELIQLEKKYFKYFYKSGYDFRELFISKILNDYYKISNTQIYQDKKDYGVIESVQSNNIMDYYLYEPLYVLKQYKNNFDSDQLELYKSEAIKQSVLDELNKLDLDKFPKKIMDLVQNMGQKQCDKDKKCCV